MRFRLRTLVRAQGGTEDAMAAGAEAGSPFMLLDGATDAAGLRPGEVGVPLEWRFTGIGRPPDDASVVTETAVLGSRAVRPLSPVHLRCLFAPDGSLDLRWVRRTRIGGDGWDGIDVPLGEEIERYRVAVGDGSGREIVLETGSPVATLGAAQQRAAFDALPASVEARVAQFSLRHGAGTERRAVFRRPPPAG